MVTMETQAVTQKREAPVSIRLVAEDRSLLEALAKREARTRQGYMKWLIRREARAVGLLKEVNTDQEQ